MADSNVANKQPSSRGDRIAAYRWKPGQSGNPGGRKRGLFTLAALRALRKKGEDGQRLVDAIIAAQIGMACKESEISTRAAIFLRDSAEGRPFTQDDGVGAPVAIQINISTVGEDNGHVSE